MLPPAAIILAVSALLASAAIGLFPRSWKAARWLLPGSIACNAIGLVLTGLVAGRSGLTFWAFLFACGAIGCGTNGLRNLLARPNRWIHRFVIYAGYAASFAGMAALSLWLEMRSVTGWLATGTLIGAYVLGSAFIFLAKTRIVQLSIRTMPEYLASLTSGQQDTGFW